MILGIIDRRKNTSKISVINKITQFIFENNNISNNQQKIIKIKACNMIDIAFLEI